MGETKKGTDTGPIRNIKAEDLPPKRQKESRLQRGSEHIHQLCRKEGGTIEGRGKKEGIIREKSAWMVLMRSVSQRFR